MIIDINFNDIDLYVNDKSFPAEFYFYENKKKIVEHILTIFSENNVRKAVVGRNIAELLFGTNINIISIINPYSVGMLGRTEIFLNIYKTDNIIEIDEIDKLILRKHKIMRLLKFNYNDNILEEIRIDKKLMELI